MKTQATTAYLLIALTGCAIVPPVPAEGTLERAKYDQRRELTRACMHNVHKQRSKIAARTHMPPVAAQCREMAERAVQ
ncbi:MAG: hypothetical protein OES38_02455 [Gammaproteobacteria bacterium]|nr:hypothetical protein [Gammaproteobacteria bacterium]